MKIYLMVDIYLLLHIIAFLYIYLVKSIEFSIKLHAVYFGMEGVCNRGMIYKLRACHIIIY